MPMNSLAVPSHSLGVKQHNELDMRNFHKENFMIVSVPLHSIPLHSISSGLTLFMGIVNICFLSAGSGKYAIPTGHLNFHFAPLVFKL